MRRLLRAVAAGAVLAVSACAGLAGPAPTPPPKSLLVLGLAPNRSSSAQTLAAQQLAGQLSGMLKVPVVVRAEPSAEALDNDLSAGSIDFAWSDALTYVALRQRHPFTPVLRAARCFPTYTANPPAPGCKPQPGTPAILICNSTLDVPELVSGGDWSALKGKRFAFEDQASLSGYVWPRYFLGLNHLDPEHDLLKGPPTPTDLAVSLSVYNGIADCGAVAGDGRLPARAVIPDVFDRTKVVFVAPGNVPGDVVFTGWRLGSGQAGRLRDGLLRLGVAAAAAGPIADLSGGSPAMLPAGDHDFDLLRAAVAAVNPRLLDGVLPAASPTRRPSPSPTHR